MNPREQPGLPLALIALCTTGGGGGFVPANIYIMGGGPPWGIQPFRARPPARLKSTSSTSRPGAIPELVSPPCIASCCSPWPFWCGWGAP